MDTAILTETSRDFDHDNDIPIPTKDDSGKDVYLCDSCGALFAYSYSLIAHKRHKCHAGKGEFKCELCHKRFNFPSQLQRHMPTHTGEKPFQCLHCPKAFNESSNLKQHMLIHTDQKPFCCDFPSCEKRFRSASNLKVHMRTHTKERPYICEYSGCGKRFVSAGDLKRHFRIHTKERPYVCQYCGKSFIQGPYLNIHIRSHTKEKPYTCTHCGKAFSRTSTLKIHLRLHTGENNSVRKKVYRCSPCNKTFDSQNNLQMHNAATHAKQEPVDADSPQNGVVLTPRTPEHNINMYKDAGMGPLPPHPVPPHFLHHHGPLPPMSDNFSYMQVDNVASTYMQSLMFDSEVPCGTLPNGQTVPLIGKNASIIRPRAKRAADNGTPLSPDFIPQVFNQRDKMGMPIPMLSLPPLNPSDYYNAPPPNSMHLADLGADLNGSKIPPLVPVPLPPVNASFNFLPPLHPMHSHDDQLFSGPMGAMQMAPMPMNSMPMTMTSMSMPMSMSADNHDHGPLPNLVDIRHMPQVPPSAQPLGSVFKPYPHHLDMNLTPLSTADIDVKPLI